jgi:hypothetical protein
VVQEVRGVQVQQHGGWLHSAGPMIVVVVVTAAQLAMQCWPSLHRPHVCLQRCAQGSLFTLCYDSFFCAHQLVMYSFPNVLCCLCTSTGLLQAC